MYLLYLIGTRMRNSLMATIYRKCLRLSNSSLQAESTGRVVTLMSNDAQKLQVSHLNGICLVHVGLQWPRKHAQRHRHTHAHALQAT